VTWIKICGVTTIEDAERVALAGADAIGLNFVAGSKRRVTLERARSLIDAVGSALEVVAVVANPSDDEVKQLRAELGVEWLQLHGDEDAARVAGLQPHAFKAVAIAVAEDARLAATFPGQRILVDTKVPGMTGGTGTVFDWQLVSELSRQRRLILAGGLTPDNVAAALRAVRPYGVDVASGVESSPGHKHPQLLSEFVRAARAAEV
jgi:phosphoribosylanthranilate isomerase